MSHVLTRLRVSTDTEPFARRVELEVPALAALLGDWPVRLEGRPGVRSNVLRVEVDARRHSWLADGVEIEMKYVWSTRSSHFGVNVQMKPMVELTSARRQSFRWWFDEWLVPLSNFVHIASAVPFRARRVHIWTKKRITPRERSDGYVSLRGLGIDSAEPDRVIDANIRHLRPVVSPDQLRNVDLHLVMQHARSSRADHEIFYGLLSSAMTATDRPTTYRYLDVITALEAFHSEGHGRGPLSDPDHTTRLQAALGEVPDAASRRFLKKWTPTTSSYSLEQRLTHLRRRVGGSWRHDAATMAKLRNSIAHGGSPPDRYVLDECFAQAVDLGRRLALVEMGVS